MLLIIELVLTSTEKKKEAYLKAKIESIIKHDQNKKDKKIIRAIHNYMYFDSNNSFRIYPNSIGFHKSYDDPSRPVIISINSSGYRGNDLRNDYDKRVVFLGDSIVFDGGVPLERTFVYQVEKKLRSKSGLNFEFINMGTSDVGIDQYYIKVKEDVCTLEPDMLFIGFYLNDAVSSQGYLGLSSMDLLEKVMNSDIFFRFQIMRKILKLYRQIKYSLKDEFRKRFKWVPRYNMRKYYTDKNESKTLIEEAYLDWGAAWLKSSWAKTRYYLEKIKKICESENIELTVFMFPVEMQIYSSLDWEELEYPQRRMKEISDELGIEFFDLLPFLKEYKNERMLADQCHYNLKGNDIVSDVIVEIIEENKLLLK